jgi:hypothetical protein
VVIFHDAEAPALAISQASFAPPWAGVGTSDMASLTNTL